MKQILLKIDEAFFAAFKSFHKLKKNKLLIWPEIQPSGVFFIKTGYIRQYLISKDGKELTVNILKPGAYFPMIWAINNIKNIYFYESLTDVSLFKAPRNEVVKQLEENSNLLYDLTKRILAGLDGITRMMEILSTGSAYEQVVYVILVLAKRFGKESENGQLIINIPLTHKLIGTLAGLSRESTSIELKKLSKRNIITKKGKFIIVNGLKKLERESLIKSVEHVIL